MSNKLLKIYEDRVASLKEQEAVLSKSLENQWATLNRLSSEIERGKQELQKIWLEAESQRNSLIRELSETRKKEEKRLLSIESALLARETSIVEKEKGINTREEALNLSIGQFLGFIEEHEKTAQNILSREEKMEEYAQILSNRTSTLFAILENLSTISSTMWEGYILAKASISLSEKLWIDQKDLADLLHIVRSDLQQIDKQKKWIKDEKTKISDQWSQIKQAQAFIS